MPDADEAGPSTSQGRRRVYPTEPFVDGRGDTLALRTFAAEDTDLPAITRLCSQELSEPYNVYTFRYFLEDCPDLTFFVFPSADDPEPLATIICRLDTHRERTSRGYIGMLSVDKRWRRRSIARRLVELAIRRMDDMGADEIVLETEFDNAPSLALYEALGFVREKRLHRFYSNGKDGFRLIRPLARHPLMRTAVVRERQEAERRALRLHKEKEGEEEGNGEVEQSVPPEIALVLAGPLASPPTAAHANAMAQLASLTLDAPRAYGNAVQTASSSVDSKPKARPPPSYIM